MVAGVCKYCCCPAAGEGVAWAGNLEKIIGTPNLRHTNLRGLNAFRRRVPKAWLGEGDMKFASQAFGGELEWVHQRDNDQNAWLDFGYFQYQIARAYQAIRPHSVIPVAFQRCPAILGLASCSDLQTELSAEIVSVIG